MELKPENGKTPTDYLLEEEKNDLQQNSANVDVSSYKTSNISLKCTNVDGYLATSRDGWLELDSETFKWKAYWKGNKDNGPFVLEAREGPYKGYYIGHKSLSTLAGVYYYWNASDWIELADDGRLVNNDLDDKALAKHTNGYFYWVTRKQGRSSEYTVLHFEKKDV